jgi:phosphate transport system permease protein
LYVNQAYATAVILFIIVALINWISGWVAKRLSRV